MQQIAKAPIVADAIEWVLASGEFLTFKYEDERRGEVSLTRDTLRRIDELLKKSIATLQDISARNPDTPLFSWTIDFANKITASEQSIDYILALSDNEFATIDRVMVDTSMIAEQKARVWIYVSKHAHWSVSFSSQTGPQDVVSFKDSFAAIAATMQPPPLQARPDNEHFSDQHRGSVLVTPESLRRLDELFAKSLTWDPREARGSTVDNESKHSWSIVFSSNRKMYRKSIAEVLDLQNSAGEEIVMLRVVSASATYQKLSFSTRRTGLEEGEWDVEFAGTPDELTVFVSEFERVSSGLLPHGAFIRKPAVPYIVAAILVSFVPVLITAWIPPDRLTSGQKIALVGGLAGISYMPAALLLGGLWKTLFPGFVCVIGDGSNRERNRKSWRAWIIGIATTLMLGGIVSLFGPPPKLSSDLPSPSITEGAPPQPDAIAPPEQQTRQ